MAGTGLSPKTLWLWEEYFWWKGEGIMNIYILSGGGNVFVKADIDDAVFGVSSCLDFSTAFIGTSA
jgi:hypothetical protein